MKHLISENAKFKLEAESKIEDLSKMISTLTELINEQKSRLQSQEIEEGEPDDEPKKTVTLSICTTPICDIQPDEKKEEVSKFKRSPEMTTINIPYGETEIDQQSFIGYSLLINVTIPSSVLVIGDLAFYGCSSLSQIIVPNSVKTICKSAFSNCTSLEKIIIPTSVTSIGDSCFYGCTSFKKCVIPSSVKKLENDTFYGCISLEEVSLPSSLETIGQNQYSSFCFIDWIIHFLWMFIFDTI